VRTFIIIFFFFQIHEVVCLFTFRLLSPPPAFRRVNFGPRFVGARFGSASTTQGNLTGSGL